MTSTLLDDYYVLITSRDKYNKFSIIEHSKVNLDSKITFKPVINSFVAKFSMIYNVGTKFYFNTDYKAPRHRVIMMDIKNLDPNKWEDSIVEVVP